MNERTESTHSKYLKHYVCVIRSLTSHVIHLKQYYPIKKGFEFETHARSLKEKGERKCSKINPLTRL